MCCLTNCNLKRSKARWITQSSSRLISKCVSDMDHWPWTGISFIVVPQPKKLAFVKICFTSVMQYIFLWSRLDRFAHHTRLDFSGSRIGTGGSSFLIIWSWKGLSSSCKGLVWNWPHWIASILKINSPISFASIIRCFWWQILLTLLSFLFSPVWKRGGWLWCLLWPLDDPGWLQGVFSVGFKLLFDDWQ